MLHVLSVAKKKEGIQAPCPNPVPETRTVFFPEKRREIRPLLQGIKSFSKHHAVLCNQGNDEARRYIDSKRVPFPCRQGMPLELVTLVFRWHDLSIEQEGEVLSRKLSLHRRWLQVWRVCVECRAFVSVYGVGTNRHRNGCWACCSFRSLNA